MIILKATKNYDHLISLEQGWYILEINREGLSSIIGILQVHNVLVAKVQKSKKINLSTWPRSPKLEASSHSQVMSMHDENHIRLKSSQILTKSKSSSIGYSTETPSILNIKSQQASHS